MLGKNSFITLNLILMTYSNNLLAKDEFVDPTKPFASEVKISKKNPSVSTLKLQGIYNRNGKREAIINRILVKEGDRILGVVIKKIEDDRVVYVKHKKQRVLTLHPKILKNLKVDG